MSKEGKLMRGLKWYQFRDKTGAYPEGIEKTEKRNDLDEYLKFIEKRDESEVIKILKELSMMARTSRKKTPKYKELLKELEASKPETKSSKKE